MTGMARTVREVALLSEILLEPEARSNPRTGSPLFLAEGRNPNGIRRCITVAASTAGPATRDDEYKKQMVS